MGIKKTLVNVVDCYFGITEANVKWVLECCLICRLNAPNATKPIVQPIVTLRCMDRIQIDLMDFRPKADGKYKYIIQIKDCFSHYVWLHPLKAKESAGVAKVMKNWFMYNGYPKILQCDHGTEFKCPLIELCKEVNVRIVNGAPYKPSTQGLVESANRTFKRRLSAKQATHGTKDRVRLLASMAIAMNITRPRGLARGTTPYEVHFGRKPHWESGAVAEYVPMEESDDEWVEPEVLEPEEVQREHEAMVSLEELFGLEITGEAGEGERNVAAMHEHQREKQREEEGESEGFRSAVEEEVEDDGMNDVERKTAEFKGCAREAFLDKQKAQNVVVLKPQDFATLRIPTKYRLVGEPARMAVRVLEERWPGKYKLMCKWGRLKSVYAHADLNAIPKWTLGMQGCEIWTNLPEYDAFGNKVNDVEPTDLISLPAAVALTQDCPSIGESQKRGRKRVAAQELPVGRVPSRAKSTSLSLIDPVLLALPDPATTPPASHHAR